MKIMMLLSIYKVYLINFVLVKKISEHTFPNVNFPFISSNIAAASLYEVYISKLLRYSSICAHSIFWTKLCC